MAKSPAVQAKQIEQEVNSILRKLDLSLVQTHDRENLLGLKQDLASAKIYINSYLLSEVREEQLANAKQGKQWLTKANRKILKASEYNIFGPVDVASLSAQIDQLKGDLQ